MTYPILSMQSQNKNGFMSEILKGDYWGYVNFDDINETLSLIIFTYVKNLRKNYPSI